jgi:hypothetical protein
MDPAALWQSMLDRNPRQRRCRLQGTLRYNLFFSLFSLFSTSTRPSPLSPMPHPPRNPPIFAVLTSSVEILLRGLPHLDFQPRDRAVPRRQAGQVVARRGVWWVLTMRVEDTAREGISERVEKMKELIRFVREQVSAAASSMPRRSARAPSRRWVSV